MGTGLVTQFPIFGILCAAAPRVLPVKAGTVGGVSLSAVTSVEGAHYCRNKGSCAMLGEAEGAHEHTSTRARAVSSTGQVRQDQRVRKAHTPIAGLPIGSLHACPQSSALPTNDA